MLGITQALHEVSQELKKLLTCLDMKKPLGNPGCLHPHIPIKDSKLDFILYGTNSHSEGEGVGGESLTCRTSEI